MTNDDHSVTFHGFATIRARDSHGLWSPMTPASATLSWLEGNPAAVSMKIDEVCWVYAIELLERAVADLTKPLIGSVGLGDVQVSRPGMSHVLIEVTSPEGAGQIQLFTSLVADFVNRVHAACPTEPEYDVDSWLEGLLGEGQS